MSYETPIFIQRNHFVVECKLNIDMHIVQCVYMYVFNNLIIHGILQNMPNFQGKIATNVAMNTCSSNCFRYRADHIH